MKSVPFERYSVFHHSKNNDGFTQRGSFSPIFSIFFEIVQKKTERKIGLTSNNGMEKAAAVVITDGKNLRAAIKLYGIYYQTLARYVKKRK